MEYEKLAKLVKEQDELIEILNEQNTMRDELITLLKNQIKRAEEIINKQNVVIRDRLLALVN